MTTTTNSTTPGTPPTPAPPPVSTPAPPPASTSATSAISTASSPDRQQSHSSILGLTRVFNRLVMPFAGTRLLPLYGILEHRGRRSGKTFRTPVVVRPTGDGFIVPMPWGEGTDWYRNVRAAGGCRIRWKGRDYEMEQPEVLDVAAARQAFSGVQQAGLTRFGITRVLHLRHRG